MSWTDKIFKLVSSVSFVGLLGMLVLLYFKNPVRPEYHYSTVTNAYYDSSTKVPPVVVNPVAVTERTVPVPMNIDSAAIVRAYFAVRTYSTQFADTNLRATITATVSENNLQRAALQYKWLRPVKTESEKVMEVQPRGWYVGGFVSASRSRAGIGPSISYLTRRELLLNARVDVLNREAMLGTEIGLKKRR